MKKSAPIYYLENENDEMIFTTCPQEYGFSLVNGEWTKEIRFTSISGKEIRYDETAKIVKGYTVSFCSCDGSNSSRKFSSIANAAKFIREEFPEDGFISTDGISRMNGIRCNFDSAHCMTLREISARRLFILSLDLNIL